jgi:hypothetical protein
MMVYYKYGGPTRPLTDYPAGITAIGPGLSAATPGDPWPFVSIITGSQRHSLQISVITSGCDILLRHSGGIASLTPGCVSYRIKSTKIFEKPYMGEKPGIVRSSKALARRLE